MPVYLIAAGDTDMVKIGWAKDVGRRIKSIQTGSPERLRVIRTIDGTQGVERGLHRHFASARAVGEWFRLIPEMLSIQPHDLDALPTQKYARRSESDAAFDTLLSAFGGRAVVAEITGAKPNAITQWRSSGVPHKFWLPLLDAAQTRGAECVTRDLLANTRPASAETEAA